MIDNLEQLRRDGETGCDLSPGDPICKWAYEEIIRLRDPCEHPTNPLNYRLSMQSITEGGDPHQKPVLCLQFKSVADMHQASAFIMEMRHEPAPKAWMKGHTSPSTPNGPAEHEVECVYGSDPPEGDGWQPLFGGQVYPSYGLPASMHWRANVRLAQKVAKLKQFVEKLHREVCTWSAHTKGEHVPGIAELNNILADNNPFDSPKLRAACICPPGTSRIDCPACGHPYLAQVTAVDELLEYLGGKQND